MANHVVMRRKLKDRLRELEELALRMEEDLRTTGDDDLAELAVERQDDPIFEQICHGCHGEIAAVRAALDRMSSGTYGRCLACEVEIPAARLDAIPFATLCLRCAEDRSVRH